MKTIRIMLTLATIMVAIGLLKIYPLIQAPLAGAATAAQLHDTVASSAWARFVASDGIPTFIKIAALLMLAFLWLPTLLTKCKEDDCKGHASTVITALMALLIVTGCTQYKTLTPIEIGPNETAWVIPLDAGGQDNQVKFNSIDYLNTKKVSAKRIMMDKTWRQTGRAWFDGEWMDAARVVKVDRSLVTALWAGTGGQGDTVPNATGVGIKVTTKDSIKLTVGVTITANINEDDASTYLYYHGARALSDVMNQNVKSYVESELTREFGNLTLHDVQDHQNNIYAILQTNTMNEFKTKGITVQFLGNAGGMHYDDPKIQDSINSSYTASQAQITAQQSFLAQQIMNSNKLSIAETEVKSAKMFEAAKEASTLQNNLQIRMIEAQARLLMASNWNGKLPANILPANSPLLMTLGAGGDTSELAAPVSK